MDRYREAPEPAPAMSEEPVSPTFESTYEPYQPKEKDDEALAQRPDHRQARVDVRVSGRMAQLLRGEITVDDLDDEELRRGQLRSANGTFSGHPNDMVPREMHDEMMRRLLRRGQDKIRKNFFDAVDTIVDVMNNSEEDALRLKAATYLYERLAGKTPEKLEISGEIKGFEQFKVVRINKKRRKKTEDIVDADVVEEEEESA